jgi:EAL domain-containing protein (putative c-di-GMP-specific phosphodiesterase class I)
LLRLSHPEGGFIPPSEFIPIAESSHLIADLGAFVLNEACREAQSWVDAGLPPRQVSVNISAAQLWHGDLEHIIETALTESGLDPALLCIELTESVCASESLNCLNGILHRLSERGIQLALDDFGTGYSSLSYLNQLPFDKLKIDRSFVANVDACPSRHKLLQGIVSLGHGLGMEVVAEGVETRAELDVVQELGCDTVQGWFYGKAQGAAEAIAETARIEGLATLAAVRVSADIKKKTIDVMAGKAVHAA